MALPGYVTLADLDTQHDAMHRKLFQFTLAILPKTFTAEPTATELPPGYAAYFESGGVRRLYFNIFSNIYSLYNTLFTTTAPDGNLTDIRGRIALYFDGAANSVWINTDGATAWKELTSTFTLGGDLILSSTDSIYFGAIATNGSWRIIRSGNDLVVERRESGAYVEKGKFTP